MAIAFISATTLDLSAETGSTSVTVPAGADFGVLCWSGYALAGLNVSSMTLNSVARTNIASVTLTGSPDDNGHGMEYWLDPADGSQTLAWTWTNEPLAGEGPAAAIAWFSGVTQTAPIRDGDIDNNSSTGGSSNTVTIDSNTTDYVLGFCGSWQNTLDLAGTGQTNLAASFTANGRFGRFGSETTPGASSTTFDAPTASDGILTAISIKVAAAGGKSPPIESRGQHALRVNALYRM
jgi:hypothetical protein